MSYINNIISIEAVTSSQITIEISVQNVTGIGNYTLDNISIGTYEEGLADDQTYTTFGTLGSGTITFTTLNKNTAEGYFSFVGGNGLGASKTISNGSSYEIRVLHINIIIDKFNGFKKQIS